MSIDMSALGLKITSDGVVKATQELTAFAKAANAANAAAGKPVRAGAGKKQVAAESRQVSTALETEAQKHNRLAEVVERAAQRQIAANNRVRASMGGGGTAGDRGLAAAQTAAMRGSSGGIGAATAQFKTFQNEATKAFRFTAHEGLNFSRQMADIGVTAAMGMNPLMIALQQGPQLFDILQMSAVRTGNSIRTVFLAAVAPIAGVLAAGAVVAGTLALAFKDIQREAGDTAGLRKFTTEMGYTKAEVEQLNAVTVTAGDTFKAIFQVGLSRIADAFGINVDTMASKWRSFMDTLGTVTRAAAATAYATIFALSDLTANVINDAKNGNLSADTLLKGARARYNQAQKFFSDVAAQAGQNARNRQNQMAKDFYDAPRGGGAGGRRASDRDPLADIMARAQEDVRAEQMRAQAIGLMAYEVYELEQRERILADLRQAKIPLNEKLNAEVNKLAAAYANAAVEADKLEAIQRAEKGAQDELADLKERGKLVGLYGRELARVTRELEAQKKLRESIPNGEIVVAPNLTGDISDEQERQDRAQFIADLGRMTRDAAEADARLRGEIGLTGAALAVYRKETELLNEAKRRDIELTPEVVEGIKQTAKSIGEAEYATQRLIERQQAFAQTATGLFMSIATGAKTAKQAIGEMILELARAEAMKAFSKIFSLGLGALSGGSKLGLGNNAIPDSWASESLVSTGDYTLPDFTKGWDFGDLTKNAKGGTYSGPGISAYSSSVVSKPTIFPFAKGVGLMGEAGEEAIMPLKRGPDGTLGVRAATNDNGRLHVSVSIDDNGNLRAMVRDEAGAVVAESAPQIVGQSVQATKRNYNKSKAGWR